VKGCPTVRWRITVAAFCRNDSEPPFFRLVQFVNFFVEFEQLLSIALDCSLNAQLQPPVGLVSRVPARRRNYLSMNPYRLTRLLEQIRPFATRQIGQCS
jgi:hypothetical protein